LIPGKCPMSELDRIKVNRSWFLLVLSLLFIFWGGCKEDSPQILLKKQSAIRKLYYLEYASKNKTVAQRDIDIIAKALNDENSGVGIKAAHVLESLAGDASQTIPALNKLIDSKNDKYVIIAALKAVSSIKINSGECVPNIIEVLKNSS